MEVRSGGLILRDLSADPLCQWQEINCARLYRVRSGERYEFDDFTVEAYAGRHTESPRGYYRNGRKFVNLDGSLQLDHWFGNLEMINYRITLCDGTRIMIWGGMTSPDPRSDVDAIGTS